MQGGQLTDLDFSMTAKDEHNPPATLVVELLSIIKGMNLKKFGIYMKGIKNELSQKICEYLASI